MAVMASMLVEGNGLVVDGVDGVVVDDMVFSQTKVRTGLDGENRSQVIESMG